MSQFEFDARGIQKASGRITEALPVVMGRIVMAAPSDQEPALQRLQELVEKFATDLEKFSPQRR